MGAASARYQETVCHLSDAGVLGWTMGDGVMDVSRDEPCDFLPKGPIGFLGGMKVLPGIW